MSLNSWKKWICECENINQEDKKDWKKVTISPEKVSFYENAYGTKKINEM